MQEAGILEKLKAKWLSKQAEEESSDENGAVVLGFENLSFPFMTLGTFMISALAIAIIERIHRRCQSGK